MSSRKRRIKRQIRILMRMDEQIRSYWPRRRVMTTFHIADAMNARIDRWMAHIGAVRWAALSEPYARQVARVKRTAANRQRLEDLAMWRKLNERDEP